MQATASCSCGRPSGRKPCRRRRSYRVPAHPASPSASHFPLCCRHVKLQLRAPIRPEELALQAELESLLIPSVIFKSAGNVKLQLRAPIRPEKLAPQAKLESLLIPLRPVSSELAPLEGPRDALPRGRTPHGLTLTYKLSLIEGGKITPRLPMMNGCAARD